ncbi:MAG: exosome complex RNA-binding protein Rrp4 [Promethearchaeota archaeon]
MNEIENEHDDDIKEEKNSDIDDNDIENNLDGKYDENENQNENFDEDKENEDEIDEFEDEETTRELVVPGEVLTDDVENFIPGRGAILNKQKNKIISLHIGLKQIKKNYVNVIPLRGLYNPKPGDKVIAIVIDKNPVKYKCDINAKYEAHLKPKNTIKKSRLIRGFRGKHQIEEEISTNKYNIGDVLIVKILSANRLSKPELTTVGKYLGKKNSGIVISIDPPKIPRVIGRNGSMIKMLKRLTNCNIFVTQNGRIWIKGEDFEHERLLIDAIYKIEREAHTIGLTDRIEEFIINEKKKRGIK